MKTPDEKFAAAASRPASDAERIGTSDGFSCTTPESIERFRQIALLQALKLKALGITIHRGLNPLKIAQEQYGIKARTAAKAVIELEGKLTALKIIERS